MKRQSVLVNSRPLATLSLCLVKNLRRAKSTQCLHKLIALPRVYDLRQCHLQVVFVLIRESTEANKTPRKPIIRLDNCIFDMISSTIVFPHNISCLSPAQSMAQDSDYSCSCHHKHPPPAFVVFCGGPQRN